MISLRSYIGELQHTLNYLPESIIDETINLLHEARMDHHQVFIMGNGGSASTATHFVCDLQKNTRCEGLPDFCAIGLADNMAILSALANDEGYDQVFAQQLSSHIHPGDIVIAISTSGNSPNVIKAIELAKRHGALTIGFTGFDGGRVDELVDIHIRIATHSIEHVEDIHLILEHLICKALREKAQEISLQHQMLLLHPTMVSETNEMGG